VNVGITAGAFLGGALLPAFGVRSTVLAGALLTLAALAVAATEPLLRPSENAEQSKRPVNAELPASERPVCA
jgi:DHA1 family inner membrane transport protein